MSFDLMVFEKTKAPMFYEDFLEWLGEQTEWKEDRDYNSLDGTSPRLAAWFMEIKETFPPLNGPYCLSEEEMFADKETENRLTDYSIGSGIIYAAFAWSAADGAGELAEKLARKHDAGFFNPQSGEISCEEMVLCKMRTERHDDKNAVWEQIEKEILSLDNPERGTSPRDNAFVVVMFAQNGTDQEFMQCMPDYPKQQGFFKKLFGSPKDSETGISSYTVEVGTGEKIYETRCGTKEQVARIFSDYYSSRSLPDISGWQDTGII